MPLQWLAATLQQLRHQALYTLPTILYTLFMVRPCFLVIDREYSASISTRKLVIETAKFNAITAYSAKEALATLDKFPNVNGVVLDAGVRDMSCADLIAGLKQKNAALPVVAIGAPGVHNCDAADHTLETFDPARLLLLLETLVPKQTAAIHAQNVQLSESLP
jgi:DNA-binding response OmpR family regulator